jgi:uncharacterized protein YdhG (YjbR/CyaY superfamily)
VVATTPTTVDEYLDGLRPDTQRVLRRIREVAHRSVPGAEETIKFSMPTITLGGRSIVHFAGWKEHVSIYPAPEPDEALDADLAPYQDPKSKGTLKFPLDRPIPYDLIGRVIAKLAEVNRPATG